MREAVGSLVTWVFRPLVQRQEGNLRLVVGCFLLSSLMWVFNSLNRNLQTQLVVPLEIRYSNRFVPIKNMPKHLVVDVEGYGWHILNNASIRPPQPVRVWIKHPGMHSRLDTAIFHEYLNNHIQGLQVKRVILDSLNIPFDHKTKKWVHMKVDKRHISLAKGYETEDVKLKPDSVQVIGPYSTLRKMSDTLFISVPFKNIDKDFNESVRLSYFFHDPRLVVSHEKINVKFRVIPTKLAHGQ